MYILKETHFFITNKNPTYVICRHIDGQLKIPTVAFDNKLVS